MQKDEKVSDLDRRLGIKTANCRNCKLNFYTFHSEHIYCPVCNMAGFKNPEPRQQRGRGRE